jgi:CheY-like chemotaxis protein
MDSEKASAPRAPGQASLPQMAQAALSGGAAAPKKILIVDDNVDAADMLGDALGYLGHEVSVAYDARRALAILERFEPSVALLDIGLPIMNGYQLAERILSTKRLAGIRLIAITGYGRPRDREQARAVGFEHHMVKPVDFALLKKLIDDGDGQETDTAAHS